MGAADAHGREGIEGWRPVQYLEYTLWHYTAHWQRIINELCEKYSTIHAQLPCIYPKNVKDGLAIVVGSCEYPPITHDVGARVNALWNTVRWEELRLFADSILPRSENALTRAWRVATYSGAANGDPEVLVRLYRESPDRLVQVVALCTGVLGRPARPRWVHGNPAGGTVNRPSGGHRTVGSGRAAWVYDRARTHAGGRRHDGRRWKSKSPGRDMAGAAHGTLCCGCGAGISCRHCDYLGFGTRLAEGNSSRAKGL